MNLVDALLRDSLAKSALVGTIVPTGENVLKEIWIAIREDGLDRIDLVGDGTKENPYDGSTALKFDRIMGSLLEFGSGANTTVHLKPGLFRTRGGDGNAQSSGAWAPRSGQRIVGSGMFAS